MIANFFINKSDKRVLNKNLQSLNVLEIQLKENVSYISPVLILRNFNTSANYVFIPSFNRYYYINDVIFSTGNTFIVYCSVDVLMSFKSEILSTQQLITRYNDDTISEVKKSPVIDDKLPISQNLELMDFISFINSNWDTYYNNDFFPENYLITTVGGGSSEN